MGVGVWVSLRDDVNDGNEYNHENITMLYEIYKFCACVVFHQFFLVRSEISIYFPMRTKLDENLD
jgi:hypothetical protein